MSVDGACELIVDVVDEWSGRCGGEIVEADGRKREDLQVDAGFVHGSEPAGPEIEQLSLEILRLRRVAEKGSSRFEEALSDEVFFEGDRAHACLDAGHSGSGAKRRSGA